MPSRHGMRPSRERDGSRATTWLQVVVTLGEGLRLNTACPASSQLAGNISLVRRVQAVRLRPRTARRVPAALVFDGGPGQVTGLPFYETISGDGGGQAGRRPAASRQNRAHDAATTDDRRRSFPEGQHEPHLERRVDGQDVLGPKK